MLLLALLACDKADVDTDAAPDCDGVDWPSHGRPFVEVCTECHSASLTGDDWLKFLDRHGGGGRFLAGPGRQLLEAPYRPSVDVSTEDLLVLVQEWIRHNQEVCR